VLLAAPVQHWRKCLFPLTDLGTARALYAALLLPPTGGQRDPSARLHTTDSSPSSSGSALRSVGRAQPHEVHHPHPTQLAPGRQQDIGAPASHPRLTSLVQ